MVFTDYCLSPLIGIFAGIGFSAEVFSKNYPQEFFEFIPFVLPYFLQILIVLLIIVVILTLVTAAVDKFYGEKFEFSDIVDNFIRYLFAMSIGFAIGVLYHSFLLSFPF